MNKVYIVWEELRDVFGNVHSREIVGVYASEEGAIRKEEYLLKKLGEGISPYYNTLYQVHP